MTFSIINQVLKNKFVIIAFAVLAIALQFPILNKKGNSDHNLGYINAVKANMAMVEYCNEIKIKDKKVFTYFITREILSNHFSGYVKENQTFTKLGHHFSTDFDYYIFSNYDTPKDEWDLRFNSKIELIKRFEFEQAWIELYKLK